ncbi:uncharacterized protein yc1106_04496 [Curvularia clavata]|uniref:Uncharacterized protein n=1 Tax=Curvularia clavata TaxID=95742 RepID=A0A9Q8Z7W2_CURCL|nr:uncharacterized protein yc1106_04496 [Curvularia clavata]
MSDTEKTATVSPSPSFTERELQILGWAMQSLRSGPPEIDYDKLAAFAGMSNPRSASNTWAKIKAKLLNPTLEGAVPATPKKTPRAKKIAAPKADSDEGDVTQTPKKTPRKRAPKKQDVDGESSPKKKPARSRKAPSDEPIKSETEETGDAGMAGMVDEDDAVGSDDEIFKTEV